MMVLKIFIAGVCFLGLTILVNIVANALKFTSWYTFLGTVQAVGFMRAVEKASPASLFWLFLGYPFTLGVLVFFLRRLI